MTVGGLLETTGCGRSVTPSPGVISVVNSPDLFREGFLSSGQTKASASASASAGLPLTTQGIHNHGLPLTGAELCPGACRRSPLAPWSSHNGRKVSSTQSTSVQGRTQEQLLGRAEALKARAVRGMRRPQTAEPWVPKLLGLDASVSGKLTCAQDARMMIHEF